jgi:hypothetical protein
VPRPPGARASVCLPPVQGGVEPVHCDQLFVAAVIDDASVLQDRHPVGLADGAQVVGDDGLPVQPGAIQSDVVG